MLKMVAGDMAPSPKMGKALSSISTITKANPKMDVTGFRL